MAFLPQLNGNMRTNIRLTCILAMSWMFLALDGSVISVLITNEAFIKTFGIDQDPNKLGDFGLFPAIGALIGQLGVAGLINRSFGRKRSFQIATFTIIVAVIMQTFTDKWGAILAGRILMGIGGDTNGLVLGYYVTEIAPKQVRGRTLIFLQQFSSQFIGIAGSWIAYGIAYLPQDQAYSWKVANSLQFVPGVAYFFLVFLLPESPRWLARKYPNDDEPMLQALSKIRGLPTTDPEIVQEATEIRQYDVWQNENDSRGIFSYLTTPRLRKRILYASVPNFAIQLGSVGLLGIYGVIIYQSLGLTTQHASLLFNSCMTILYALAALGSSYVVEKLGRRPCIVWGSCLNTLFLACLAGIFVGVEGRETKVSNGFCLFLLVAINFNYWFLWTGPTTIYVNEIMPSHAREFGTAVCNVIPIAIGITLGQKWPLATADLGAKSYLVLLSCSALGSIGVYFFVKEPKGLSIERIDALFGENDHVDEIQEQDALKLHGGIQSTEEKILDEAVHVELTETGEIHHLGA